MQRREVIEYRILSKAPGETRWKFRQFSGAGPHTSPEHLAKGLRDARRSSPGWKFKPQARLVIIETGDWRNTKEPPPAPPWQPAESGNS
jgi:hypothetical protein